MENNLLYFHKYSENELSLLLTELGKNENLDVSKMLKNFENNENLDE